MIAQPLAPLTLPLQGTHLVEASAGTGKTYTIASLVLRLLLGHGGAAAHPRPLAVDEVLVVTFTEAATAELGDRVRTRVREARDRLLGGEPAADPGDVTSAMLAELLAAGVAQEALLRRLEAALARMDEAATCTIHGFCRRLLRDSAFETGSLFDLAYERDDRAWRLAAVEDTWRALVYTGPEDLSPFALGLFPDPDRLHDEVAGWLAASDLQFANGPTLSQDAALAALRQALDQARTAWVEEDVAAGIDAAPYKTGEGSPGRRQLLDALDLLLAAPGRAAVPGADTAALVQVYGSRGLGDRGSLHKRAKGDLVQAPGFIAAMDAAAAAVAALHAALRVAAIDGARQRHAEALERAATLVPDTLLQRVHQALTGPAGARLAARVRELFPAAMIDEFQDTDSLQYAIFHQVYGEHGADPAAATCLLLIGDPKQAIYGFRGADVYAYLAARDRLPEARRWTLGTNWRSAPAALDGVAALYGHAAGLPGEGFLTEGVAFAPVACGRDDLAGQLTLDAAPAAGLHCCWLAPPEGESAHAKAAADDALAEHAAAQVAWLRSAAWQRDGQPLAAADICVLVRTHAEAERVRTALGARGIASVYLSRAPVFSTPEARDLLLLLEAVLEPRNERRVRAALASRLFDLPLDGLAERFADPERWAADQARFTAWRELLTGRGVLALLRAVLSEHEVPRRLLARPAGQGDRRLTDLRHLAELLDTEAARLDSPHALLLWLRSAVAGGGEQAAEESQLRLDSDAHLVQVATLHAAKGLEYQVVLLPYACLQVPRAARGQARLLHRRAGDGWQAVLDLAPDEVAEARWWREQVAEELRLLYVGLTRARLATLVSVAPVTARAVRGIPPARSRHSALGVLLHGFDPAAGSGEPADLLAVLEQLAQRPGVACHRQVPDLPALADSAAPGLDDLAVRPAPGVAGQGWEVTSYSALVRGSGETALPPTPGTSDEAPDPALPVAVPSGLAGVAAAFPRGPAAGSCLHRILELHHLGAGARGAPLAEALVARQLADAGFTGVAPGVVTRWLQRVLALPLAPLAVDLAGLLARPGGAVSELEFLLAVDGVDRAALVAELAAAGLNAAPLGSGTLRGLLRGFVDLVFEHNGALWVVDYKSNWLGPGPADRAAMDAAMAHHRYDLQALLYAVALRRWQRARGGSATPGGVLYLFLRGMDLDGSGPADAGVWSWQPDPDLLDRVDALLAPPTTGVG